MVRVRRVLARMIRKAWLVFGWGAVLTLLVDGLQHLKVGLQFLHGLVQLLEAHSATS